MVPMFKDVEDLVAGSGISLTGMDWEISLTEAVLGTLLTGMDSVR